LDRLSGTTGTWLRVPLDKLATERVVLYAPTSAPRCESARLNRDAGLQGSPRTLVPHQDLGVSRHGWACAARSRGTLEAEALPLSGLMPGASEPCASAKHHEGETS
jgi:hypothetical protein